MHIDNKSPWAAALAMLFAQSVPAAPIEGELSSNAAALLVVLGVWALFMGMRNVRELRHKRPNLSRVSKGGGTQVLENPDTEEHN